MTRQNADLQAERAYRRQQAGKAWQNWDAGAQAATSDVVVCATAQIATATISDDDDRTASAQLYWILLMICQGLALNRVLWAGDGEGLGAWRQLTEKFEPKTRRRFVGQLMSIWSFSHKAAGPTDFQSESGRLPPANGTGGKVLDDEIKIGTFLIKLPESRLKTRLSVDVR